MTITIEVPIALPSVANMREHWAVKARRVKSQRAATFMMLGLSRVVERLGGRGAVTASTRLSVTLTRVAPRPIRDEHDNLRSALKGPVDEIARFFGVDDGETTRIVWIYRQAKGKPSCLRIELAVETRS